MSVLELNELVKACEEEFGVSAAAGCCSSSSWRRRQQQLKNRLNSQLFLQEVGGEKIKVIKAVREITGLGTEGS